MTGSAMSAETAMPRVSRSCGPTRAKAAPQEATDVRTLNASSPFSNGASSCLSAGRVVRRNSLTECVAKVGAILILWKPENRDKLPFFMGIKRVRYRRPVYAGEVVEIEARVKRLRSRMGELEGFARVGGHTVVDGTMTFALGPTQGRDG